MDSRLVAHAGGPQDSFSGMSLSEAGGTWESHEQSTHAAAPSEESGAIVGGAMSRARYC
jgi:hypothetical protein